jgi:hypothetical protein
MMIPRIGHTEQTSNEQKLIYQKWHLPEIGFYWLVAEIDPESNLAYGYANLNDNQCAEWGYFSLKELENTGAKLDLDWSPQIFQTIEAALAN